MGHTIDISEWLDFEFYNLVWYWDERKADMADDTKKIGRWLGIAHFSSFSLDFAGPQRGSMNNSGLQHHQV